MNILRPLGILIMLAIIICCSQKQLDYFNQTTPEDIPQIFAPDLISDSNRYEICASYSPDGKEFFFVESDEYWSYSNIWHYKISSNQFIADSNFLSSMVNAGEPFVSPDNSKMFFVSTQGHANWIFDIWYCNRLDDSWGIPKKLSGLINSDSCEYHPTVALNGNMYFLSERNGGFSQFKGDIFCSEFKNGEYQKPFALDTCINTRSMEADPYIAPDESYLIFVRDVAGHFGNHDLFISFKMENNKWSTPKSLGEQINTQAFEFSPKVTPDGKFLMFSRRETPVTKTQTDILWVSMDKILSLK